MQWSNTHLSILVHAAELRQATRGGRLTSNAHLRDQMMMGRSLSDRESCCIGRSA